jgi:hypothetical protein
MRKMFFVILIITAISSFYSAQPPSARAEETKTFVGTIKSFPYGFRFKSGPPLWPFGMIEVSANNGQQNNFLIVGSGLRATIFYDIDGENLGTVTASLSKTEVAKKVEIGKKVEVTYTTPPETARFINRNLAISVRYVTADYVPQPTAPAAQAGSNPISTQTISSDVGNVFVGKVVKGGVTFSLHCPYRFVIVTDNGEKKDIWVPRDNMRITDINGNSVYGVPPRANKRMEIKYSIGDNGQYEAVSMRYLP